MPMELVDQRCWGIPRLVFWGYLPFQPLPWTLTRTWNSRNSLNATQKGGPKTARKSRSIACLIFIHFFFFLFFFAFYWIFYGTPPFSFFFHFFFFCIGKQTNKIITARVTFCKWYLGRRVRGNWNDCIIYKVMNGVWCGGTGQGSRQGEGWAWVSPDVRLLVPHPCLGEEERGEEMGSGLAWHQPSPDIGSWAWCVCVCVWERERERERERDPVCVASRKRETE